VISDPYCDELHVRSEPQIVLLPEGRPSRRSRLLKRGLVEVSCRWKLKLLFDARGIRQRHHRHQRQRVRIEAVRGMTLPGKLLTSYFTLFLTQT
jgi:hypothetical protein